MEEVLLDNPSYLLWAHRKTDIFRMTEELLLEVDAAVASKPKWSGYANEDEDYESNFYFEPVGPFDF